MGRIRRCARRARASRRRIGAACVLFVAATRRIVRRVVLARHRHVPVSLPRAANARRVGPPRSSLGIGRILVASRGVRSVSPFNRGNNRTTLDNESSVDGARARCLHRLEDQAIARRTIAMANSPTATSCARSNACAKMSRHCARRCARLPPTAARPARRPRSKSSASTRRSMRCATNGGSGASMHLAARWPCSPHKRSSAPPAARLAAMRRPAARAQRRRQRRSHRSHRSHRFRPSRLIRLIRPFHRIRQCRRRAARRAFARPHPAPAHRCRRPRRLRSSPNPHRAVPRRAARVGR